MTATLTEKRVRLRELITQIDIDEQLRKRAAQQAILEAEAWHWAKRAEAFHAAAPRPGDFRGNANRDDLLDAWQRCRGTALACLRKAAVLRWEAGDPLEDPAGYQPKGGKRAGVQPGQRDTGQPTKAPTTAVLDTATTAERRGREPR